MIASPIIEWFAENLVWASAAMLLVLAIRRPVARLFGAGVAYALWLIPAVRQVAPPGEWLAGPINTSMPSLPPLMLIVEPGAGAAPPPLGGPGQWVPILLAVWAGGAILFLLYQAVRYRRFLNRMRRSMRSAGDHAGVTLIESAAVDGPLALGLLHRRIVVPTGFESRYGPAERRLALDHERHHHRRGDILANHVALLVLALNWFNPVAWAAFRAFRADQELSCDAAIAAAADPQARADYARALVKSASRPGLIAACPLNGADQLKWRLKMLNHHRKDRRRAWAGGAATALLIGGSLMLGSPGVAQEIATPLSSAIEQREADTNRALLAALRERRATIVREAEESADPGAAKERTRDAIAFLDTSIQEVQSRSESQERPMILIMEQDKEGRPRREVSADRVQFRIRRDENGHIVSRDLAPELSAQLQRCRTNESGAIDVTEGSGNERTRILFCAKSGEMSAEQRLKALEEVRTRIAGRSDERGGEHKTRLLEAIDGEIARLRGQ